MMAFMIIKGNIICWHFLKALPSADNLHCILREITVYFSDEVFSLKIWGHFIQQCVLWRQNLIRAGDVTVCYKLYVDCSWNLFNFRNDGKIEVIQQKMNEYLLVNLDSLSKQGSVAKRFLISVKKRPCYNTVELASEKCSSLHLCIPVLRFAMKE